MKIEASKCDFVIVKVPFGINPSSERNVNGSGGRKLPSETRRGGQVLKGSLA
jgi:hypothetical protein